MPSASTCISLPLVLQLAARPWVTDSRQSFPESTLELLNHFRLPLSLLSCPLSCQHPSPLYYSLTSDFLVFLSPPSKGLLSPTPISLCMSLFQCLPFCLLCFPPILSLLFLHLPVFLTFGASLYVRTTPAVQGLWSNGVESDRKEKTWKIRIEIEGRKKYVLNLQYVEVELREFCGRIEAGFVGVRGSRTAQDNPQNQPAWPPRGSQRLN